MRRGTKLGRAARVNGLGVFSHYLIATSEPYHMFFLLVCGAAMFISAVSLLREKPRWAQGQCSSCGYDRRGRPAASVCPECGRAPATRKPDWAARFLAAPPLGVAALVIVLMCYYGAFWLSGLTGLLVAVGLALTWMTAQLMARWYRSGALMALCAGASVLIGLRGVWVHVDVAILARPDALSGMQIILHTAGLWGLPLAVAAGGAVRAVVAELW